MKANREDRIEKLKLLILGKKFAIEEKSQKVEGIKGNLKKIDRFANEKLSEGKYYQEVFKAF